MKRLVALLSVVTALMLSGVATAPASAGTVTFHGVTVSCVKTPDADQDEPTAGDATYTVTYGTHSFTFKIPDATCLV
jgi:type 1 fimbria pilin